MPRLSTDSRDVLSATVRGNYQIDQLLLADLLTVCEPLGEHLEKLYPLAPTGTPNLRSSRLTTKDCVRAETNSH